MTENIPMPDDSIVPTQNGYGWTSTVPNQVTLACVDWIRECSISSTFVLDIGAGLGVGTLPLLEAGARVTAIDLDGASLLKCFGAAGFTVDQGWYYTRYGLPDSLRNDGGEHYGLIATKGKTSS